MWDINSFGDKQVCFICSRQADRALDSIRSQCGGAVFKCMGELYADERYLSASERYIDAFWSFLNTVRAQSASGNRCPIFIYDFFDFIDEAVDILPFIDALIATDRQVFIALGYRLPGLDDRRVQIIKL